MPDLKLVLGTVNYTDYLRVSAAKVSDPGTEVFVEYINTPVSNYTLIIPDLDPDNYYINFRDAPDTASLGTLVSQAFVNAQTGEWEYERRFYRVGDLPSGASLSADGTVLTDAYLENKTVSGIFKEGYRYLELGDEATHDDAAGTITLAGGISLSDGEVLAVEITYSVGVASTVSASGLFADTISVTAATYTVDPGDKYKRFSLDCAGTKQEVTLPALSALATGDYFYFEHRREGAQAQTRIKCAGSDTILYNGLALGTNDLTELWVSKGGCLYLRKEGTNWEVIGDYEGHRVGERMAAGYKDHVLWIPEDGRLMDGDEYPALYWFIRNVLPSTHYISDSGVSSGSYAHPSNKPGLFVIHPTGKAFRMPDTQGLSEKGLLDFNTYGADSSRAYDYPGGYQADQVKSHDHALQYYRNDTGGGDQQWTYYLDSDKGAIALPAATYKTASEGGSENTVKNVGVVYCRRI